MRRSLIALSGCLILLPTIDALRSSPRPNNDVTSTSPKRNHLKYQNQRPLTAAMPEDSHPVQLAVRLSDTLPSNRAVSSFGSFARQNDAVSERLSSGGGGGGGTTVLAPLNSAIEALPSKPWEKAGDIEALGAQAYEGEGGKDRADGNLRRFVEAHVVSQSPWPAGAKAKTMAGTEVWWEEKDGRRVIMPDKVEVDKVAIEVGNGQIWILKGVLTSA